MSYHFFSFLFFAMCVGLSCSTTRYTITPSQTDPESCSQGATCFTLSQFAAYSKDCHDNNESITNDALLLFLPGNHTLDRELHLTHANNISMTKATPGDVIIKCLRGSGRFIVNDTNSASINGLHFIGCHGNTVDNVTQLEIADTIFEGVNSGDTALILNHVSIADIVNSSFNFNSHKSDTHAAISKLLFSDIVNSIYREQDSSFLASGALYVAFSNVSMTQSKFMHNRGEIGGAINARNSSFDIEECIFSNNSATFGGVMVTIGCRVNIENSHFIENVVESDGGVMLAYEDDFIIQNSTFSRNNGSYGGVTATYKSSFTITDCIFTDNRAEQDGGVMRAYNENFIIFQNSGFSQNTAHYGGVLDTYPENTSLCGGAIDTCNNSFTITDCTFSENAATESGGAIISYGDSFTIQNTTFTDNTGFSGGVIHTCTSSFTMTGSTFDGNTAALGGVAYIESESKFDSALTTFTKNTAVYIGGVIFMTDSSSNISNSTFSMNKANDSGAVLYSVNGSLKVDNSEFNLNAARYAYVVHTVGSSVHMSNTKFTRNTGSFYAVNSEIAFSEYTKFENCTEPSKTTTLAENAILGREGGAITSYQSTVTFRGKTDLLKNRARTGGAMLAIESTITVDAEMTIANNLATIDGGGIVLFDTKLEIEENCNISYNQAERRGGGISASSSTITVYEPKTLQFIDNSAHNGGGAYLEEKSKMYILKPTLSEKEDRLMFFKGNNASNGGAIYVADNTSVGTCSADVDCFVQALALYRSFPRNFMLNTEKNIHFSDNFAKERGSNIFGGNLDRCIPNQFSQQSLHKLGHKYGLSYLKSISNVKQDTVSSLPVRVCFCNDIGEPDCSYQPPTINVTRGQMFTLSLVAVDQANHTVASNIVSVPSSSRSTLGSNQKIQTSGTNCTDITFNVFSPNDAERIDIFADGPCRSAEPSTSHVTVQFLDCTCPVGFEQYSHSTPETDCQCICSSALSDYITDCNSTTSSLTRRNTNSWIFYVNGTDPPSYIVHPYCPFDYCFPQATSVSMNLNLPQGSDAQCAYSRSGMLCGACPPNLSLSLGSSRCLNCSTYWPGYLTVILLVFIFAGVLLVTAVLFLNITVADGLINGFIFYANIVSAGQSVFFPSSAPSLPSVFVAWLNLDIGIDVCFFDGLDTYIKTWLQLFFPVYIIFLVYFVIILSEYSPTFARLIGKRDPIATLATLVLLSYTKLLSITITALSFTVLNYPDGSQETVWLPDGNVKYFQGKHIPLALMALLIILIGLPYTILLFLWQWLVCAPRWKLFKWTRNTKLNSFVTSHHVPHNEKYRFWTGLLLLVRVFIYVTASTTMSANPQALLIMTILLVGGLIFLSKIYGLSVYKELRVEIVDTLMYFNLIGLAALSLYKFKSDDTKQTVVIYVSTVTTFFLLAGVIAYHVILTVRKGRIPKHCLSKNEEFESNMNPKPPMNVTHSVIEFPKVDVDDSASPEPPSVGKPVCFYTQTMTDASMTSSA